MPNQTIKLPILSLSRHVLFPGSTVTLLFTPGRGLELLRHCYASGAAFALLHHSRDAGAEERYAKIGVAAQVLQIRELENQNGAVTLTVDRRLHLL
ncbi:MAG: LON peptidase substrate-binding domain-containing protein, partial [bacterium]